MNNEEKYQLELRDLPPVKLVQIINEYREELKSCMGVFRDYAEKNLALDPWLKVISARKAEQIRIIIEDIKVLIPEWYKK